MVQSSNLTDHLWSLCSKAHIPSDQPLMIPRYPCLRRGYLGIICGWSSGIWAFEQRDHAWSVRLLWMMQSQCPNSWFTRNNRPSVDRSNFSPSVCLCVASWWCNHRGLNNDAFLTYLDTFSPSYCPVLWPLHWYYVHSRLHSTPHSISSCTLSSVREKVYCSTSQAQTGTCLQTQTGKLPSNWQRCDTFLGIPF